MPWGRADQGCKRCATGGARAVKKSKARCAGTRKVGKRDHREGVMGLEPRQRVGSGAVGSGVVSQQRQSNGQNNSQHGLRLVQICNYGECRQLGAYGLRAQSLGGPPLQRADDDVQPSMPGAVPLSAVAMPTFGQQQRMLRRRGASNTVDRDSGRDNAGAAGLPVGLPRATSIVILVESQE